LTGVLIGIAAILLLLSQNQVAGEERKLTLPARMLGGLGLCCLSASIVLPFVMAPRNNIEGRVTDFHQVTGIRQSRFEFSVNSNDRVSPVLRAYYFDKGFYFGDPAISDGDRIRVSYVTWTNDALEITETVGRHKGWTYRESNNNAGPWLMGVIGAVLFFGGLIGWISDKAAEVDPANV
jgi:hypothetical protein